MHAVILAGGKGVRLRPYTTSLPKPLVPIGDQYSILEIIMRQLAQQGFQTVTLAIGHLGQLIRAYVGDGSQWGMKVDYAVEESPLGTIGPLLMLRERLPEHFLVMNGDILTDLDFGDLLAQHRRAAAPLTVATYAREVKIDFGVLTAHEGTDHRVHREAHHRLPGQHGRLRRLQRRARPLHPGPAARLRRAGARPARRRRPAARVPVRRPLARHRPPRRLRPRQRRVRDAPPLAPARVGGLLNLGAR